MIYTVTLNPALDRTIYLEKLVSWEPNKIIKEERYAAGKGIDVSRVLLELGVQNIALGFLGGFTGKEITGLLFNEGVNMNFVPIRGETRTNIIIHTSTGEEYVIKADGPNIEPDELAEFYYLVKNLQRKPDYVVLSGSVPRGLSNSIYEQLILLFESQGARVIVDSSGEPLKRAIVATPFMVKPNRFEFQELVGKELNSFEDIVEEAIKVHREGVEFVVVSLGGNGAICVCDDGIFWAYPPKVEVKNSVGAGDSFVAGVVAALYWGKRFDEALVFGVATGTATALKMGTAKAKKEDIQNVLKGVILKKI